MARPSRPFPSARDTGTGFPLAIKTTAGTVEGETVPEFLIAVLRHIEEAGAWKRLEIPLKTTDGGTGGNFLLAYAPQHSTGRPFGAHVVFEPKGKKQSVYVNTNHPRFFGLRQGVRLLEAAGFDVLY